MHLAFYVGIATHILYVYNTCYFRPRPRRRRPRRRRPRPKKVKQCDFEITLFIVNETEKEKSYILD